MPFSTTAKNTMLDAELGSGTPATVYAAAYVSDTEVSGNGYARVAITNNDTNWPDAASGAKANGAAINFPEATGSWGTIDEIRIQRAASGENVICTATVSKLIESGDTLSIDVGDFDLTISDS